MLQEWKAALQTGLERLEAANALWEPTSAGIKAARDKLRDLKQQALVKAGAVVGKLRGLVRSDEGAYSYTKPAPKKGERASGSNEDAPGGSTGPDASEGTGPG